MIKSCSGKWFLLLAEAFLLLGCALPALPGYPTPIPTLDVENSIIETFSAAQTQTAALLPSTSPSLLPTDHLPSVTATLQGTLLPTQVRPLPSHTPTTTLRYTLTPTEKPTITSTPLPIPPTPTHVPTFSGDIATKVKTPTIDPDFSGKHWSCKILSHYPPDGAIFHPGEAFVASWKLKNTGGQMWWVNNVDYLYQKGTEMHLQSRYDIPKTVLPNETVTIKVPMVAPNEKDAYHTIWALDAGNRIFCYMQVAIRVK